jgi:hypothetical protein
MVQTFLETPHVFYQIWLIAFLHFKFGEHQLESFYTQKGPKFKTA